MLYRTVAFFLGYIFFLATGFTSTNAMAQSPLDDLANVFKASCVSNAGTTAEFTRSRIEAGFESNETSVQLRAFWKASDRCKIEYHFPQKEKRSPKVTAMMEEIANDLANRLNGTLELRRKGKRNEYFIVTTAEGAFSIAAEAARSGEVTGMSISRRR